MLLLLELEILLLKLFLQFHFVLLLFGELLPGLFELFLLLGCNFFRLGSEDHLLFHFLKPIHELLLLVPLFLLALFPLSNFVQKSLLFLVLEICHCFNLLFLLFEGFEASMFG